MRLGDDRRALRRLIGGVANADAGLEENRDAVDLGLHRAGRPADHDARMINRRRQGERAAGDGVNVGLEQREAALDLAERVGGGGENDLATVRAHRLAQSGDDRDHKSDADFQGVVDQARARRGHLDHAVVEVDFAGRDLELAEAELERNLARTEDDLRAARMLQMDFVGVFIEQNLMTGGGRKQALFFAGGRGPLIARPPAAGPDRRRSIARFEFNPDAVADFGQRARGRVADRRTGARAWPSRYRGRDRKPRARGP